jgi:rubrerythrin
MIDKHTTPLDALKMALEMESRAHDLYKKASEVVESPGAREMFRFLAEEEVRHKELIQDEIEKELYKEM